jgi:phosphinothricin acetyltransferase
MEYPVEIRSARPVDAAAIAGLYNAGIRGRTATFETRERDVAEIDEWLSDPLPLLVAVVGDDVLGYARASRYSSRPAYDGVGEHSVYVDSAARGRGIARDLLRALASACERQGLHKLTSRVFVDNVPSRKAHTAAGFVEIGTHRRHARLDGRWKDCVIVERLLGPAVVPESVTS